MKTNYRPRSNSPSSGKRLTLVLAVLVIGGIFFYFVRGPLLTLTSPLWRGINNMSVGMRNTLGLFDGKEALIAENQHLKEQLASYNDLAAAFRSVSDSRETLLAVYGRSASSTGVAATVLVRPPATPYDVLIIDAGQNAGVAEGDEVFLPQGAGLIGKVVQVSPDQARVQLYTTSGLQTGAILERNSVPVMLVGRGGNNFDIELPKDVEALAGDRIITPGVRGEVIGVVGDVEQAPTDSSEHLLVRSVTNLSMVRFVSVHTH